LAGFCFGQRKINPLNVRFTATLPGTYTGYVAIGGNLLGPAGTTRFNLSVTATYSGQSQGSVSGTTGSNGKVSLSTNSVLRPRNKWCFTVTALSKAGYTYNASANVVTAKCE
jgi:hypothetical protein